jgi:cysteine desulfurase / selenocysteine lyase
MIFHNDFPALKSSTYFNTAYVGLMSQKLYDFRSGFEINYLLNADQYKIEAYDCLDHTHQAISGFIGSEKEQTYFVSNFSVGIRFVLDSLIKGSNVLYLKDDYHSLVDALHERDFNHIGLSIEESLEDKIEQALAQKNFHALIISIVQFTHGLKIDFDFLAQLKEKYPQLLIIGDATQHIGADLFDFNASPFDAIACSGYKWLLAGFGNGFIALSDHFFEETNTSREDFQQKVFSGHFNILGAASLVFALEYLRALDFEKLVHKNKALSQKLRSELIKIGWIPEYHQRKLQSTIVSISTKESILKQLEEQGVRASYRGNYLRFSTHFYNSTQEIDKLIDLLKQLILV